jgi:hypothetical protein
MTVESYLRTAGPPLAPAEIKAVLRGQQDRPQIKAVLELLVLHITQQRAAATEHPLSMTPEERHYNSGAAAAAEDFLAALGEYLGN